VRIIQKLIAGFLVVASLVLVTGFVGYYSINIINKQTAISDAARDMGLNINADRSNLHQYMLTEDPDKLTQLYESSEKLYDITVMWIEALCHGTDSKEFKSNDDVYKTWEEGGYEAKGRSVSFDPKIAGRVREIEELLEASEVVFFEAKTAHDKRLAAKARFADNYPKGKDLRYALMDTVYATNNPTLFRDMGYIAYYSKEALFQYGDEEHINMWYDSITTLKTDVATQDVLTPEESGVLSTTCDEYYATAKRLGNIILYIKKIEADALAKLTVFDEYVVKIKEKEEGIISTTAIRTDETKARATSTLITVTVITLMLGLTLGFIIAHSISKPVTELKNVAAEIGKGNLDAKIEIKSRDEIGDLAASLRKMRKYLKESIFAKAAIIDGMPDAVGVMDLDGSITQINKAAEDIWGYTIEELIGRPFEDFIANDSLPKLAEAQKAETGKGAVRNLELVAVKKDGTEYPALFNTSQSKGPDDKLSEIIFTLKDITELRQAEDEIRASLKEKEILLKEIHHRVKNNLQIITSLLDLQSGYIKDNQALQLFKESQSRVRSMALIHERLYNSGNLARIDFADYTRQLAGECG